MPATPRFSGAICQSRTVASCCLICRLAATIVAGGRPVSLGVCLRWLPVWFPGSGRRRVTRIHIYSLVGRAADAGEFTRSPKTTTRPGLTLLCGRIRTVSISGIARIPVAGQSINNHATGLDLTGAAGSGGKRGKRGYCLTDQSGDARQPPSAAVRRESHARSVAAAPRRVHPR